MYSIQRIAQIIHAEALLQHAENAIEHLLIDSRKNIVPQSSLFFALPSARRNAHSYIPELVERGVRHFVVSEKPSNTLLSTANFLVVPNTLTALQQLAAHHRQQFHIPVIGITGSNGKTVVKEWLYQLLHHQFTIVRSPKSYNSQVGVPLSVWNIEATHKWAIFEAGISMPGEMEKLQTIIQPTIGVLTHIGEAHDEGFSSPQQKLFEKCKLFKNSEVLIYEKDRSNYIDVNQYLTTEAQQWLQQIQLFCWSRLDESADVYVIEEKKTDNATTLHLQHKKENFSVVIPFTDKASIDNAMSCISVLLYVSQSIPSIVTNIAHLQPVEMRLELKQGINNCSVINDSYSSDLSSLRIALDFLQQQHQHTYKTVILSDILESGIAADVLYKTIAAALQQHSIHKIIGIGINISQHAAIFNQAYKLNAQFFESVHDFLLYYPLSQFKDETILLKGARIFAFEQIEQRLIKQVHQTKLEINLSAIAHNLKAYQQQIRPGVKTMAMVKAFSYGSGSAEIANVLQFHKVDYLAVAYADEGVELRKSGIRLPIMVMNADENSFDALIQYNLEPEIYSFSILDAFHQYLIRQGLQQYPIHIKLDTGMHRLGFLFNEIDTLCTQLQSYTTLIVQTIFSHLAASEDVAEDAYTLHQYKSFIRACTIIQKAIGYTCIKHISNSAAIFRLPQLQCDMVRLGIGLYGIDSSRKHQLNLQHVSTLKSTIAQIKKLPAGATVGYNRKGKLLRDSTIAVIRIGYADGLSRKLSNGVGKVWVKEKLAPIIGNICMDMTMIDITGIQHVQNGDEVVIFGKENTVEQLAKWCDTISYEVLTTISQRVRRVYFME